MRTAATLAFGIVFGLVGGYYIGYDQGVKAAFGTPVSEESMTKLANAMQQIIGTWISQDDAQFMRAFAPDGKVTDRYGEEVTDGDSYWMIFSKEIPDPQYTGPLEDGALYLAIAKTNEESLYFEIATLNENELALVYLNRGGVLTFSRQP